MPPLVNGKRGSVGRGAARRVRHPRHRRRVPGKPTARRLSIIATVRVKRTRARCARSCSTGR